MPNLCHILFSHTQYFHTDTRNDNYIGHIFPCGEYLQHGWTCFSYQAQRTMMITCDWRSVRILKKKLSRSEPRSVMLHRLSSIVNVVLALVDFPNDQAYSLPSGPVNTRLLKLHSTSSIPLID